MAVITAAVVGGGLAIAGGIEKKKAAKASASAARSRAAITKLENARQRRSQVREFAIQRGSAVAQAATRGGGGGGFGGVAGSAVQGQVAGLATQLKSNLAFIDEAGALNEQASQQEIRAISKQGSAALFGAGASAAFSVGGLF
jgi:outer membrane murein-binding lipoprotein Lpp